MNEYRVCSFYVAERLEDVLHRGRKNRDAEPTVDDYWLLNVLVEGFLQEIQRNVGINRIKEGRDESKDS